MPPFFADNPSYERPYGWAWFLLLYSEVDDELRETLRPLAAKLVESATRYFTDLIAPITHGVHSNTAFAGVLMSDAAAQLTESDPLAGQFTELTATIERRAREWYAPISDWPAALERSGHDFLSPGLTIAELMAIVLPADEFAAFVDRFLPSLDQDSPIVVPANTRGSRDAHQVHWHGLNLSRSGQLRRIAAATGRDELLAYADDLYAASLDEVTGDNYASTHWLASFALRALV